eukprot:snap_masked-scaffold_10-processed-gene-7.13-mRNA-1 protein AED:1.00 eAED:1.00 QI:0/-1/0/0/-1/1/1/0/560
MQTRARSKASVKQETPSKSESSVHGFRRKKTLKEKTSVLDSDSEFSTRAKEIHHSSTPCKTYCFGTISFLSILVLALSFLHELSQNSINENVEINKKFNRYKALEQESVSTISFPMGFDISTISYHGETDTLNGHDFLERFNEEKEIEEIDPEEVFQQRVDNLRLDFDTFAKNELEEAKRKQSNGEKVVLDENVKGIILLKKKMSNEKKFLELKKKQGEVQEKLSDVLQKEVEYDFGYKDSKVRVRIPNELVKRGLQVKNERFLDERLEFGLLELKRSEWSFQSEVTSENNEIFSQVLSKLGYKNGTAEKTALVEILFDEECGAKPLQGLVSETSLKPILFCNLINKNSLGIEVDVLNEFVKYSTLDLALLDSFEVKAKSFFNSILQRIESDFRIGHTDSSGARFGINCFLIVSDFENLSAHYAGSSVDLQGLPKGLKEMRQFGIDPKKLEKDIVTFSTYLLLRKLLDFVGHESIEQTRYFLNALVLQHVCFGFNLVIEDGKQSLEFVGFESCDLGRVNDLVRGRMLEGGIQLGEAMMQGRGDEFKSLFKVFDVSNNQIL